MKRSELRELIKEELQKLKEASERGIIIEPYRDTPVAYWGTKKEIDIIIKKADSSTNWGRFSLYNSKGPFDYSLLKAKAKIMSYADILKVINI